MSAISNWQQKNDGTRLEDADLIIKTAFVDSAMSLKRFRPAPHGRAHRIRKRSNHVTIIVDSRTSSTTAEALVEEVVEAAKVVEAPKKKEAKKVASKKTEAKKAAPKKEAVKKEAKADDKKPEAKKAAPKKEAAKKAPAKKEDNKDNKE